MPTYEYKCKKCGVFEMFQRITEEPLTNCPKCNEDVRRIISKNVGVVYKTGGFYCVDNRKSDSSSVDNKETGSSGSKAS
mgnify:CR=1 FL=1